MNDQEKHELNVRVHTEILDKEAYTQEQMKAWAEEVWKTQPFCIYFSQGFSLKSGRFYGSRENPQIDANSPLVFEQPIDDYSGELCSAWSVFERFAAMGWGHSHTRFAVDSTETIEQIENGQEFFVAIWKDYHNVTVHRPDLCEAICVCGLAVVAYLKNLEIEKKANEIINAELDKHVRNQVTAESSLPDEARADDSEFREQLKNLKF